MGKRALFLSLMIVFVAVTASWLWLQTAPLTALERGGAGPPTVVLLHGYGSRAEDWLQFEPPPPAGFGGSGPPSPTDVGDARGWQFPENTRRVYPQAPWRGFGHHGWWWLHLARYMDQGRHLPDLSSADPGGIRVAAQLVRDRMRGAPQPLILGGFSQGAMVSAEIAFQTDQELHALILLSGTTVHVEKWAEHFAGRRSLPIFIAHGRSDPVLSFDQMDQFRRRLQAFGMDVTWYPFDGAHEIPSDVIDQVNAFVQRVLRPAHQPG